MPGEFLRPFGAVPRTEWLVPLFRACVAGDGSQGPGVHHRPGRQLRLARGMAWGPNSSGPVAQRPKARRILGHCEGLGTLVAVGFEIFFLGQFFKLSKMGTAVEEQMLTWVGCRFWDVGHLRMWNFQTPRPYGRTRKSPTWSMPFATLSQNRQGRSQNEETLVARCSFFGCLYHQFYMAIHHAFTTLHNYIDTTHNVDIYICVYSIHI